jgi:hypothetical protein
VNEEQHRQEMFKQTNQAAIDFSKMTLTTSFLLNGVAATALLASKEPTFYAPAILLGFGALSAIVGMGVSYLYILLLGETWRKKTSSFHAKEIEISVVGKVKLISCNDIETLRIVPVIFAVYSISLFFASMI